MMRSHIEWRAAAWCRPRSVGASVPVGVKHCARTGGVFILRSREGSRGVVECPPSKLSVERHPTTRMSTALSQKKQAEGEECMRAAAKALKTSAMSFKFRPDWETACAEYEKAITCFKVRAAGQ